jgi:queuine tRNA-ribosyltransferase
VSFAFAIDATEGPARAGVLTVPHGTVSTPAFMPVGTQGTVRALSPLDLDAIGAEMLLANTYHLHVRPGEDVVAALGGLHRFMAWPRPILTDSGGFQVFSLDGLREVSEDGVIFQSHVDGSKRMISPERAIEIQWTLGPDIAMAFDHVIPGTADHGAARDALERTTRWLARCRARHDQLVAEADVPHRQVVWPIVQGATFLDLRRQSVADILAMADWTGLAIGGLAVGETKRATETVLAELEPSLPRNLPRYLMGVGFPDDLLRAIARGIDMFDCVAPTRNGRNGTAFTPDGPLHVKNAAHKTDRAPLDETCGCETCRLYSRGYLRHLFAADELLGLRLLSLHNVRFLIGLASQAREHIAEGTFAGWHRDWLERYNRRGTS